VLLALDLEEKNNRKGVNLKQHVIIKDRGALVKPKVGRVIMEKKKL